MVADKVGGGGSPTVSVVVLNYNGLHHLEDCFLSLMELDYSAEKLELILVDNASKQNPSEFMRSRFPSVKVIVNPQNFGFAEGSNVGARAATGQYVAFLNNDTRVDPGFIKYLVEAVEADPDVISAGSRILNWEGTAIDFIGAELNFYGHGFQESFRSKDVDKYSDKREVLFACGGAMLINRSVFLESGGFDADYFAFFEDVDLGWRMWLLGYKVVLEPKSVVYHKHHSTASQLQSEWKYVMYERNALYTIIKNYNQANLDKILPVALLLSVKRGLVYTGILKETYYLADTAALERKRPEKNLVSISEANAPEPELSAVEKVKASWREEGALATFGHIIRKIVNVASFGLVGRIRRVPKNTDLAFRIGMAHFVGLDDVIENLAPILEKRAAIQNKRKRADAEILRLFGAPLKSNCLDDAYMIAQQEAVAALRLDELFAEKSGLDERSGL